MAIRLRKNLFTRFLVNPWGRAFVFTFLISVTLGLGVFTYFYVKYAGLVDGKLRNGPFANTSLLYAAPRPVRTGDPATPEELSQYLLRCGYTESNSSRMGWFKIRPDAIEINPGPDAFDRTGAVIKIAGGKVNEIIALSDHAPREVYYLEPELITNLFDSKREKRRIVRYNDIPKVMLNAALSAEDKHFFQHAGFDPIAIARAVVVDLTEPSKLHGASTITQQVAKNFLLTNEVSFARKIKEALLAMRIERAYSKDRILELAHRHRLPVVLFAEGGGGRPGDTDTPVISGLDTMAFALYARLSGHVPLVGIAAGYCFAGNAAPEPGDEGVDEDAGEEAARIETTGVAEHERANPPGFLLREGERRGAADGVTEQDGAF